MLNVSFNVGLLKAAEYNLEAVEVFKLLKNALRYCGRFEEWKVLQSSGGDWAPEPIIWANFTVKDDISVTAMLRTLESVCVVLHEDSIAVKVEPYGHGKLVFNPNYKGEKYDFNVEYFTE